MQYRSVSCQVRPLSRRRPPASRVQPEVVLTLAFPLQTADWKQRHKQQCAFFKREAGRAEVSAMASPYAPLMIEETPLFMNSLLLELPYLLAEAWKSLTSSTHVCYITGEPPSAPRPAALSRDALSSQRLVPITLNFAFDPRNRTTRTQFSLESAKLLTRQEVNDVMAELDEAAGDASGGRSFAQTEARETMLQAVKGSTSFYIISHVYMAGDERGSTGQTVTQSGVYRARLRPDVLERPAKGSEDWLQFVRLALRKPQPIYQRLDGVEVHPVSEAEAMDGAFEVARLIAVKLCDYPTNMDVSVYDPRVMRVLGAFEGRPPLPGASTCCRSLAIGTSTLPQLHLKPGQPRTSQDAKFERDVDSLRTYFAEDGLRKILANR